LKRTAVLLLVLVIIVGAGDLAAALWRARTAPDEATQFLAGLGVKAGQAEQLIARLPGKAKPAEEQPLMVSGSIEGDESSIVSEFGGRITGLRVDEGDQVEAGEVLVELDTSLLRAQAAQAEAAVAAAEATLANVKAGTHPAEILAAQASLDQAIAKKAAAETSCKYATAILDNPQEIDAQIVQARAKVDMAAVQIEQAEAQLAKAKVERDRYRAQGSMQEKWLYAVYDYQVKAAQAALDAARADKKGMDEMLAALGALRDHPLALVSQVNIAEAQYNIATAGVAVAKAKLTELKAGPTPEEVAVAEAQVAQAEAAVSGLQTRIDKMTLRSPMAGMVTSRSVHPGEAAVAGAKLLSVANLDQLKLTLYIPENQLGRVYLGQGVQVQVDSFPGRIFTGTVAYISQQAEFTPKNIQTENERVNMVFAVRVRLPNPEHLLKPGMPADALIRN